MQRVEAANGTERPRQQPRVECGTLISQMTVPFQDVPLVNTICARDQRRCESWEIWFAEKEVDMQRKTPARSYPGFLFPMR